MDDIQNTICETEYDLLLLDEEIDQLQAILAELQRKHNALADHLQAHRNLLAPVRKLPVEILSRIFTLCLPDQEYNDGGYTLRKSVMLPGQICRPWRDIAHSSPMLWSSISLAVTWYLKPELMLLAMIWLRRSAGCPLSLRITGTQTHHGEIHALLDLVVACSSRWKHIDLDIGLFQYGILHDVKRFLPCLETLVLRDTRDSTSVLDVFESAPQLHSVELQVQLWKVKLPWHQLTSLSISSCSLDVFLAILETGLDLLKCAVTVDDYRLIPRTDLVEHARLRSLSIVAEDNHIAVFDYLRLPALSDLEYTDELYPFAPSRLISLLKRSSCQLRTLTITFERCSLSDDDLIHILRLSPLLQELELKYSCCFGGVSNKVMTQLTYKDRGDPDSALLTPELQILKLTRRRLNATYRFAYSVLADMIESRWRLDNSVDSQTRVARLQCVNVSLDRDLARVDPIAIARLRRFKNEGLNIEMMDRHGDRV
jgi:hypothetical protein